MEHGKQNLTPKQLMFKYAEAITVTDKQTALKTFLKVCRDQAFNLLKQGWEETPNGLLSPQDIKEAGFVRKNNEYCIPTEICMAETSGAGHNIGQKFLGVTRQYITWRKKREARYSSEQQTNSFIIREMQRELEDISILQALS